MNEILIDGVIGNGQGEISSGMIRAMLPEDQTEPITVKLHSEGGSVFEGFAIFDLFKNYAGPKKVIIESSAFSISSFIPMAFDEVEISPNGYMMLHNPWTGVEGDDEDLEKQAGLLKALKQNMIEAYANRTGKSVEEIAAILKEETYLSATDAVAQGFADRIAGEPVHGRVFARLDKMPQGVVSALFGVDSGGDTVSEKETPMSETIKAVATVKQIKAAYPKASNDFIIRCMEKEMAMEEVTEENAIAMDEENEALRAKVAAMEEELEAFRAKAMEEEETAKAQDEEEEEVAMEEETAKARRSGVTPVSKKRAAGFPNAAAAWQSAIDKELAKGKNRQQAVVAANRSNPGLRQQFVESCNN